MGSYFAAHISSSAPDLPVPAQVRLWPDGDGGWLLTWQRPLGAFDGYAVLRGPAPEGLALVARLEARLLRWRVPSGQRCLALACTRQEQLGPSSACVLIEPEERGAEAEPQEQLNETASAHPLTLSPAHPLTRSPAHHYSTCACCVPAQPLLPGESGLACAQSGEAHLLLDNGAALLLSSLPYGVCRCCAPAAPLIRCGEEVVCYNRPEQRYARQASGWQPLTAAHMQPLADAAAIDAALRANSALLGANGIFVRERRTGE